MRIPPCVQSHFREEMKQPLHHTEVLSTTCGLSVSSDLSVTLGDRRNFYAHFIGKETSPERAKVTQQVNG